MTARALTLRLGKEGLAAHQKIVVPPHPCSKATFTTSAATATATSSYSYSGRNRCFHSSALLVNSLKQFNAHHSSSSTSVYGGSRSYSSYPAPSSSEFASSSSSSTDAAAQKKKRNKVTIEDLYKMKRKSMPITMMTAHDYPSGLFCERAAATSSLEGEGAEIDMVLVALSMVSLGFDSTNPITLDEMLHHCRAVSRSCKTPFLIGDLPFGSYEVSDEEAIRSSVRFLKEGGGIQAVKLEGGREMAKRVKKITEVGIPLLGHIGLTPQRASALSGFKAQGRTLEKAKFLLEDALALQEAGAFSIVLEAVPEIVAKAITDRLKVPTIGIGAGPFTSGQVLVQLDILGAYDKLAPKFSKIYANVGEQSINAIKAYGREVKSGKFPLSGTHTFKMLPGEEDAFKGWLKLN